MQSTIGSTTQANIPIAQARAGEFVASTGRESYVAWSATGNTSCHTNENQVDRDCDPTAIAGKFHSNQQYSVTAITNSTAGIVERYAYQAYGEPTILDGSANVISSSSISNRYTYTGREWDGTVALYHFRARWMSGLTGRFLSRDPIGYWGSKWNLQEYVNAIFFFYLDPEGLSGWGIVPPVGSGHLHYPIVLIPPPINPGVVVTPVVVSTYPVFATYVAPVTACFYASGSSSVIGIGASINGCTARSHARWRSCAEISLLSLLE